MTDEELKAIEARAEAATPGPWQADVDCFDHDEPEIEACVTNPGSNAQFLFTSGTGFMNQGGERERAEQWRQAKGSQELRDAAFIASARTDVPALVKALREAREERDAYRKAKAENDERFMTERDAARAEAARWKEAHAEVVRERDRLKDDLADATTLGGTLTEHEASKGVRAALLAQLAESRTHVALLREALGHVVDCKNLDLFSCSCGLARRALAATPSTASDELVALREVVEAAREEHGARNREPECPICCALARLDALHGKGGA